MTDKLPKGERMARDTNTDTLTRGTTLPGGFYKAVESQSKIEYINSVPKMLQKAWAFYMEHKDA